MSARAKMRHRATIQRDRNAGAEGERDSWGNPAEPDWTDHLERVPCHAWFESGVEHVGETNAVVEDRRMIMPRGTDVSEGDRITAITDRRGNPLEGFEGTMRIESVGGRRDHLTLHLQAV